MGLEENSGWNWTPMKYGWSEDISQTQKQNSTFPPLMKSLSKQQICNTTIFRNNIPTYLVSINLTGLKDLLSTLNIFEQLSLVGSKACTMFYVSMVGPNERYAIHFVLVFEVPFCHRKIYSGSNPLSSNHYNNSVKQVSITISMLQTRSEKGGLPVHAAKQ